MIRLHKSNKTFHTKIYGAMFLPLFSPPPSPHSRFYAPYKFTTPLEFTPSPLLNRHETVYAPGCNLKKIWSFNIIKVYVKDSSFVARYWKRVRRMAVAMEYAFHLKLENMVFIKILITGNSFLRLQKRLQKKHGKVDNRRVNERLKNSKTVSQKEINSELLVNETAFSTTLIISHRQVWSTLFQQVTLLPPCLPRSGHPQITFLRVSSSIFWW